MEKTQWGLKKGQRWRVKLACPIFVTGDLSSISGSEDSDSSSEEDLLTQNEGRAEFEKPNRPRGFYPHRVLFKNAQGQFLYAYRCVLGPHQASNSTGCVINPSSYIYTQTGFSLAHACLISSLPFGFGYHTSQHNLELKLARILKGSTVKG